MTAREWTIVALRAAVSLIFGVLALVALNYGVNHGGFSLVLAIGSTFLAVGFGLIAYARLHDFRFQAAYRRQIR